MLEPPAELNLETCLFLITTFSDFLIVAIHAILYERAIYPPASFISAREYNFPIRQNRHPKVCKWIMDAVAAVEIELQKGTVNRVVVVIYSPDAVPLERFIFDVSSFPEVSVEELLAEFEDLDSDSDKDKDVDEDEDEESDEESDEDEEQHEGNIKVNLINVEEQLREAVRKLAYCGSKLSPLPKGCSFTVVVELKDKSNALKEHPRAWIPSPLSLQTGEKDYSKRIGSDLGGARSVPLPLVESGPFVLEMWIEEGKAK